MNVSRVLVLGYGNPGRQDDGLGPWIAERVEAAELAGVTVDSAYQLNIEDAATAAEHDIVLFVDASESGPAPFELRRLAPAEEIAFTTHCLPPEAVLAICEDHFSARPEGWVLGVRGYEFEFMADMTAQAKENSERALDFVLSWLQRGGDTEWIKKQAE